MRLEDEIIKGLKAKFNFKSEKGNWMQQGVCPSCGKKEAFCAANDPKIVKCGRSDNCGWEDSVINLLPDLFEDWSRRYPPTQTDPNAAADAYLIHERGLNISGLRGCYTQETYHDAKINATSATIRFALPEKTYWERIIDKVGRFERKANFQWGGKWQGNWWAHPDDGFDILAAVDEIWLVEGIFDALALREAGLLAVSLMSVNNYPELALAKLRKAIADGKTPKERPKLIFAFDVGAAGVSYSKKFIKQAKAEGWDAVCAQVRPDGDGTKLDWNDLFLRHQTFKGDGADAPLADKALDEYLWNGSVTVAETPREKAKLMFGKYKWSSFEFRHGNRIWWAKASFDDNSAPQLDVNEICNCSFRILYREYNDVTKDANYFIQIDFPTAQKSEKANFSAAACATSGEFKKRLMAFAGIWSGSAEQLDRIMRQQTRNLRTVQPIDFTGYSAPHKAWILGEIAVHAGRVIPINKERYFDIGRDSVKRSSSQNLLDITYNPDRLNFDWLDDIWKAWGVKGIVAFAFFTMSAFAVQIREKHKSLGFLEIMGEGGSGKTTLIETLWRSFGRYGYEGIDPNKGTVVYLARSMMGVSNLPVGLIEGNRDKDKTSHSRQFDWSELLTLYNGRNPRGIGMKSSGNETSEPPFLGSIYLMQNDPISAIPPVLERIMSMEINKANWSDETRAAAIRMEAMPMEDMSATLVHLVKQEANFLPFFFERFKLHDAQMPGRVPGLHNARCIKCHSQLAASVEALAKMFPIPDERISQTVKFVDQMALNRQQSAGGDHPLVAEFWEKVDYILRNEDDDRHAQGTSLNKHRKSEYIAINLPHFEAAVRNAGLQPLNMESLKRLLRNSQSRKFVAVQSVNPPTGKVMACWVFAQPQERVI